MDNEDNVVRDLEELKNSLGKSLEMVKSHSEIFTNINGHQEAHSNMNEQLNENGKLVAKLGQQLDTLPGPNGAPIAKLRTNVDIPSKGIHKTVEQPIDSRQVLQPTENGNRRSNMELLTANPDNLPVNGYLVPKIISDMHMPELIKVKRNVCQRS